MIRRSNKVKCDPILSCIQRKEEMYANPGKRNKSDSLRVTTLVPLLEDQTICYVTNAIRGADIKKSRRMTA